MRWMLTIVTLVASTAFARLPDEECAAARKDVRSFADAVHSARSKADELKQSAASLKSRTDWKNALDGLSTVAFMTAKVVSNAIALAKGGASAALKAVSLADGSSSLDGLLKNLLAVDKADKLKAKMQVREQALEIAEQVAKAADEDAKQLEGSLDEANDALAKFGCGRVE